MDQEAAKLAAAIGARVKHERKGRGWTLDQLADAGSVSRRMVVNVEQGAVNPSVGTLLRLSDALGVGLPSLVEPPEPKSVTVTRSGAGAKLWTGAKGGRGVLVAGTTPPDVLELWDWSLGPGDRHTSESHVVGTKELVHVLVGTITVEVDDQVVVLETGDALAFPGDVNHAYTNPHSRQARFSLAVFEPGVGTASETRHG
ncbi:helix-turn-helix domain-containing protein [Mycolicibacterium parafortuitum]|uniref:Xre family DNA binding protein [Microlunatus phosphovorus NM-1] n=1 Tax=Mycolicibacterium parafortuitum TaxID=39692 RepID=A0A375YK79_MYCPF|nr:XRE family transcriptional regulator [Mycolicibacterium parafortuitum]ORB23574.1 XRE family transcriptional regulator [Mycolicibacterium parafortuitum]SRX81502.1 Xre family DNA binding protein [Microlunatus phosphovorus NM-1] [Mycolicibacterium parafortuitum]